MVRVSQGWSGEVSSTQWAKFKVELDEEDLRRLLAVAGVNPQHVSVPQAFALLEIEAERLVLTKLMSRYGYPADAGQVRLSSLAQQKTLLLSRLPR